MIITEELVKKAIEMARILADGLLQTPELTWGPTWADGEISAPGLDVPVQFQFGKEVEWNPEWGEKVDFGPVAASKRRLAERYDMTTSAIVALYPWLLENGEFLYAGGDSRAGISVGISGAKGRADEAIAETLINLVAMLARLSADDRSAKGKDQID